MPSSPVIPRADLAQRILACLRHHEDEMAALISELIAIPTENPPGNHYLACANLLEARLRDHDLESRRYQAPLNVENQRDTPVSLSAHYGQGERTLYFHGHYDVVPAQSSAQFRPIRDGHFLFGRGSCDMKGGIVAMLFAILALREC